MPTATSLKEFLSDLMDVEHIPRPADEEWNDMIDRINTPGVVSVIDDQRLETLETLVTESGAHTICWNPHTRTLYAFLPGSGGAAVFVEQ